MNKIAIKKTFAILLFIFCCYCLYEIIGYFILGLKTPKIFGSTNNTEFMGMYILCFTYFILFIVASSLCFFINLSLKKINKNNIEIIRQNSDIDGENKEIHVIVTNLET